MPNITINLRVAPAAGDLRTPTKIKAYARNDKGFLLNDAAKTAVAESSPHNDGVPFAEWELTADGDGYTAEITLHSTTDSPDRPNEARWGLYVFDQNDRLLYPVAGLDAFALDHHELAQDSEYIIIYNKGRWPVVMIGSRTVDGSLTVNGGLTVNGNAIIEGALGVGTINVDNLTTGFLTALANAIINGALQVGGHAQVAGTLTANKLVGDGSGVWGVVAAGPGGTSSEGPLSLISDTNNTGNGAIPGIIGGGGAAETLFLQLPKQPFWMKYGGTGGGRVNVRAYGAVGDGVANDSPAFQAALDALATIGGGRLHVPAGEYKLASPVLKNFNALASSILITGEGSNSILIIASGVGTTTLSLRNLYTVRFRDLAIRGQVGTFTDARHALEFRAIWQTVFDNVQIYGVATENGHTIYTWETDLLFINSGIRGCLTRDTINVPSRPLATIYAEEWRGLQVENSHFVDHGALNGYFWDKTASGDGVIWVEFGNPREQADAFNPQGVARISQSHFDEGGAPSIVARSNNGQRFEHLTVEQCHINIGINAGISIEQANRVTIRDTTVGYKEVSGPAGRLAVFLNDVGVAHLKHVRAAYKADTIRATETVGYLLLEDSEYKVLDSQASRTEIIERGARNHLALRAQSEPVRRAPIGESAFHFDRATNKVLLSISGSPFAPIAGGPDVTTILEDDFSLTGRDLGKWDEVSSGGGVTIEQTTGRLRLTPTPNHVGPSVGGYQSAATLNLSASSWRAVVELAATTQGAGGGAVEAAEMMLRLDDNNLIKAGVLNQTIFFTSAFAGSWTGVEIAYDSVAHRWLAIAYDADSDEIVWETSPDGVAWTERRRIARGISLAALKARLHLFQSQSLAVSGVAEFDNFALVEHPAEAFAGLPQTVAAINLAAQTASLPDTVLFTPAEAGLYEASIYAVVTTAGSGGTLAAAVKFNDGAATQNFATQTASLATLGAFAFLPARTFYAAAGQPVQFSTTVSGAAGAPQYRLVVVVKRVG